MDVADTIPMSDSDRPVLIGFYRATACNATHGITVGILSVCPSVRQMRVL